MLIRLLQQVTDIKLVQEVNPEAVPAPGWSESGISDGSDNVKIKAHLTMYVEVSAIYFPYCDDEKVLMSCCRADCGSK